MNFILIFIFVIWLAKGIQTLNVTNFENEVTFTGSQEIYDDQINPAIIEGYQANLTEFPYAVRLYSVLGNSLVMCTGEIVHKKLVLTAAHCIKKKSSMIIVAGSSDHTDFVNGAEIDKYARYKISEVFMHPKFSEDRYEHDVAVLKTSREMVHPGFAVIPVSYERLTNPVNVTIFGWGGTEETKKNHKLYAKHLKAKNCSFDSKIKTKYQYICLMDKGVLKGDSGGGLIYNGTVIGVTSFYKKEEHIKLPKDEIYFYTALAEEEEFVKACLEKNETNFNRSSQLIIFLIFIFITF